MHIATPIRSTLARAAAAAALALLVGCSSPAKIFINENPGANIAAYKTYNYQSQLGTDEREGYRSILSNYLIAATDKALQARGYTRAADPDMIVNFYVNTEEKIRTTSTPSAPMPMGYYGYRGGYYGAYGGYNTYETRVTQYTEGTLNIDLVDADKKELAWEGVTVGRITDEVRENLELAVNTAVADILAKFNYTAPGYVPLTAGGNDG
ncbi:MAG: DUF4136 domain-containing protein [Gammaproteobacteria bacterium]|nr:DUF4136 domain-containing protein [Gammaproteobacteria bacterium]